MFFTKILIYRNTKQSIWFLYGIIKDFASFIKHRQVGNFQSIQKGTQKLVAILVYKRFCKVIFYEMNLKFLKIRENFQK